MEFFKNFFEKKSSREEIYKEIQDLVKELDGYINAPFFQDQLDKMGILGGYISDESFIELLNSLKNNSTDDRQKILDKWLIKNDQNTALIASTRSHFGMHKDEEGIMSYPDLVSEPGDLTNKENIEYEENEYRRRMEEAREVFGDDFDKEKLDLFYCDSLAGPQFEIKIQEVAELISQKPEDRDQIISSFYSNLENKE